MLDKSIPYIGIIMEKKDTDRYPVYSLPSGYSFCNYEYGLEEAWCRIQFGVEHTGSPEEAREIFKREFLPYPEQLSRQCIFVKAENGDIVATAALWHGMHFGKPLWRLHWVAVSEKHQGKGIAKALVTKLMDIFNELGFKDYIYLTSQTWSYKAINIYLQFGFRPYMGPKPSNWKENNFEENAVKAWDMIMDRIGKRYK